MRDKAFLATKVWTSGAATGVKQMQASSADMRTPRIDRQVRFQRRSAAMSEAEVMQGVFSSIQVVISLFSTFFAMISAYIAGLYFFLNRAPFALKLLAFFLLSIGLVFLGGAAITQQRLQMGLLAAWGKLPSTRCCAIRSPPRCRPGGRSTTWASTLDG
jgi:hypothetical protein